MNTIITRCLAVLVAGLLILVPRTSRGDFFGGDIPLLIEIVANTAQQLVRLREIVQTGRENIELIRNINRGINDSLQILRTAFPNVDPGIYGSWERVDQATREIEKIYGVTVHSPEARVQRDADQSVAEAVSLNNSMYKYTRDIDKVGESINSYSHAVSPGGAQKLTAQGIGIMLTVMNQGLRAQATGLKLQAQMLALQNRKEKETTRKLLENTEALKVSMKSQDTSFELPRF